MSVDFTRDDWADGLKKHLYTAVIGDVLDELGRTSQFLPAGIRAIRPDMVVVGRAMPVLIGDTFGPQPTPFGKLTEALDQLAPHEIYLARGGRTPCASWGEVLTVAAKVRGAAGAVIDGFHRDTTGTLTHDFPVFSRGSYGQDSGVRASVVDYRVPVEIGGVAVTPGDLVFGDIDGVVVIPQDIEAEVLEQAQARATSENEVLVAIANGMSSTEAFDSFGVL